MLDYTVTKVISMFFLNIGILIINIIACIFMLVMIEKIVLYLKIVPSLSARIFGTMMIILAFYNATPSFSSLIKLPFKMFDIGSVKFTVDESNNSIKNYNLMHEGGIKNEK